MCGSGGQVFESTSHMPRNMVSGKPSTRMARQMDTSPPLDFYFMFTRTDVWEYVLQGRQEYGFCSRATDVCPAHIGVRTVLQSLVVALIHNPEYEGNGCFGTIFGCSKRVC
jgi:hypothetical protein